jgi:uncharacterized protein YndB with AHSA1/START domain
MSAAAQVTQKVKSSPEQVFYAFTHAAALREWLCDFATVQPHPGRRIYLAWDSGYTMSGEFTRVEPAKALGFTWFGRGEPGPTLVSVEIAPAGEMTMVTLTHGEIEAGEAWDGLERKFKNDWTETLENLASVLETGIDLRIARRPLLGIYLNDFNAQIAHKMGVPVSEGVRLDGVVEGLGPAKAGLQKDDVLVSMGGTLLKSSESIPQAITGKRAGDVVEVTYYRGPDRRTVNMALSARKMPEVPFDPVTLAEQVRSVYAADYAELEGCLKSVTEVQAAHRPAEGEWGAREVLAHLIIDERELQGFITFLTFGEEFVTEDISGNFNPRINAVVQAYPTIVEILELLRRTNAETIALIAALPSDFAARKSSYYRVGSIMLQRSGHIQSHLEQIKDALASYPG